LIVAAIAASPAGVPRVGQRDPGEQQALVVALLKSVITMLHDSSDHDRSAIIVCTIVYSLARVGRFRPPSKLP